MNEDDMAEAGDWDEPNMALSACLSAGGEKSKVPEKLNEAEPDLVPDACLKTIIEEDHIEADGKVQADEPDTACNRPDSVASASAKIETDTTEAGSTGLT